MPRRSTLRASDADRDGILDRLRTAAHEGRISTDELEHRLGAALKARTYGELDRLVADLPGKRVAQQRRRGAHGRAVAAAHPVATTVVVLATVTALVAAIAVVALLSAAWIGWVVFMWVFCAVKRRGRAYGGANRTRRLSNAQRGAVGGFTPWL